MRKHRAVAAGMMVAIALACAVTWGQSALSTLGVSENQARSLADSAVDGSYGYSQLTKPFLKLMPAARAATVAQGIAWAKMYFNSAAFKKSWADKREASKPTPPKTTGSTEDEISKSNADMQKQIDDMRKVAASLPPDQRKAIETAIQQITAQTAAVAKDPARQALQRQSIEASRTNDQKRYQDDLKKWEQDFPADPSIVIARRLHEFLTMSAAVNFDAKLMSHDGRQYFADPQFERMPSTWKICYRAGQEATAAARAGATAWLKELGK